MRLGKLYIMTEGKLLRWGWEQQIKAAQDAYWQGREDERDRIDSPYFKPINRSGDLYRMTEPTIYDLYEQHLRFVRNNPLPVNPYKDITPVPDYIINGNINFKEEK